MKLRIALIRCGRTESGEQNRYLGKEDEPLSPGGRAALEGYVGSGAYPDVSLVYTSGALRCRETAALLYPRVPAVIMNDLRPFDYGEFEGKTCGELLADKQLEAWLWDEYAWTAPGGENMQYFCARCIRVFRQVVDEMNSKGLDSTAIITHNAVIGAILRRYGVPRSEYRNWSVEWGKGHLVEYDSSLCTATSLCLL